MKNPKNRIHQQNYRQKTHFEEKKNTPIDKLLGVVQMWRELTKTRAHTLALSHQYQTISQ